MKQNIRTIDYPCIDGQASWMSDKSISQNKEKLSKARSRKTIIGLRHVSIPSSLVSTFAQMATPNTNRPPYGIETCAILAGTLMEDTLQITTLIVPKQNGSADTCTMTNEEELFDYCITHELLTLGWIHVR